MFESLKQLTKHSIVYGIGHIVARSIGFLLLPLYTNYLLPKEYGIAALIFSYLAIMNVFYTYGLDTAFLRFFILAKDEQEKRRIFSTAFSSIIMTSVLFSTLVLLLSPEVSEVIFTSPDYAHLIKLASGILLFDSLGVLPFLILRAEQKSIRFVLLKSINVTLTLGLNILFIVHLGKGVAGIFISNLITSFLTLIILIPIVTRWFFLTLSRPIYSDLLRFGLPYIPSGLAVILMDLIDRFILERMAGLEVTGIYSAGYKLGMVMALFVAAFRFAWHPFFLSTSREENAKEIFSRVLTYFLLASSVVFLVISFFINNIVRFQLFGFTVFGQKYWEGTVIVPVIMLAYIFYGIYVNFVVGIYLEKKTAHLPYITGTGALVNVLGNLLLIPVLGMTGAAYATLLAYVVMATILFLVSRRYYPIRYEFTRLAKIAFSAGLIFFLGRINHDIPFRILLLGLYPFLLLAIGFFDKAQIRRLLRWRGLT